MYELIDTAIEHVGITLTDERGRIIEVLFRKYQHEPDDINESKFINIFTLKDCFIHLFEEPVEFYTWLRIKQPGTYTIHFDLIDPRSFSFELHTRDEVILISEHNPKHNINLKGENCFLVYKKSLRLLEQVQKYMFIIM